MNHQGKTQEAMQSSFLYFLTLTKLTENSFFSSESLGSSLVWANENAEDLSEYLEQDLLFFYVLFSGFSYCRMTLSSPNQELVEAEHFTLGILRAIVYEGNGMSYRRLSLKV